MPGYGIGCSWAVHETRSFAWHRRQRFNRSVLGHPYEVCFSCALALLINQLGKIAGAHHVTVTPAEGGRLSPPVQWLRILMMTR